MPTKIQGSLPVDCCGHTARPSVAPHADGWGKVKAAETVNDTLEDAAEE